MIDKDMPMLRIPTSTYRLQFNHQFTFRDALKIVPYLHELGITDVYASPYFMASSGSMHGYDIINHNSINPEIGTEEEYDQFVNELRRFNMGQLLDIVPNHMCITDKNNLWWMDILENGPSSTFAGFFDIDWKPVKRELKNRILLPFLGNQYGNVLENGEITLKFENGSFFIVYYEHIFPVRPQTYIQILGHRLEELKKTLGNESVPLIELLSIITALKNLPSVLETDIERVLERNREKEVAKKRLWTLYCEDESIRSFVDENVRIFNGIKGNPKSFDLLDGLLCEQIYRLSYWSVATEEINYRRFFDINSLAAIRMENAAVFEEAHRLLFRLIRERKVTGLRVDHPDGLYNPSEYFQLLQEGCFRNVMLDYVEKIKGDIPLRYGEHYTNNEISKRYDEMLASDPEGKPFYIVGEKILIKSERMPEEWPIFSTTGYVFLNSLNGIFIETRNARIFDRVYSGFTKLKMNYQAMVSENKRLIMKSAMASEINTLGGFLNRISEKNRHTRDFTLNSLIKAITEVIAYFPVYRTYINKWNVKERDRQQIDLAVLKAKRRNPSINASIFDFLHNVLLLSLPDTMNEEDKKECFAFALKFQQLTGPVMAKAVEDTTFYVYNRLLSLNEVGGSPDRFGTPLETFHGQNIERSKFWPQAMITTSTHDSKRSEDVRARINVLSEIPDQWRNRLLAWSRLNKNKKIAVDGQAAPDRNEEYFFYQTLLGIWPIEEMNASEYAVFISRIQAHMLKAIREAKIHTSWTNVNGLYEEAVAVFVESAMRKSPENAFLKDFILFQKMVSHYGMFNSLSQTLLKITSPGIPDFYQGTEVWNLSLVDPDNRRPVNHDINIRMLADIKAQASRMPLPEFAKELTVNKEDGRIKMYVIQKSLEYRNEKKALFQNGEYIFLEIFGTQAYNICAFARRYKNAVAISIAPRFFTRLSRGVEDLPIGIDTWKDSIVAMLSDKKGVRYRNIFTGEMLATDNYDGITGLSLAEVFKNFPVALLDLADLDL